MKSIHGMTTTQLRHMLAVEQDESDPRDPEDRRLIQAIRDEIEERKIHGKSLVSTQPY